jgi:hypothetical protein
MHLIDINGCSFYTEREKDYFTKKRSYRLDKKLHTGQCLTLISTIKINMTKEHEEYITPKLQAKGFYDITEAIISLSYHGDFQKRNINHNLGFMGGLYGKDRKNLRISSYWEILSPNQETYDNNLTSLLNRISEMLEIDKIVLIERGEETELDDVYADFFKVQSGNIIGYGETPVFALD